MASIQSSIGNITRTATESVKSVISNVTGKFDGIVGTASTAVTNVWSGGFAGINTANADSLKTAINTYIQGIQETINGFNENANLENAYKGSVQVATQEFLRAVKALLQAHVSLMRQNLSEFELVIQNYTQASQEAGSQVSQQAEEIRANAESIRID